MILGCSYLVSEASRKQCQRHANSDVYAVVMHGRTGIG